MESIPVTFDFGVDIDDPIKEFLEQNRAKETVYNTTSHLNRLKSFMRQMHEHRDIWNI